MKTSLNGLFLTALSGLTASAFAAEPVNNDYWRISSNVYMELEKFEDITIILMIAKFLIKPA